MFYIISYRLFPDLHDLTDNQVYPFIKNHFQMWASNMIIRLLRKDLSIACFKST